MEGGKKLYVSMYIFMLMNISVWVSICILATDPANRKKNFDAYGQWRKER